MSSIILPSPLYHFQSKQKYDVLQENGPLCDISDMHMQLLGQDGSFSEINEIGFNISQITCFGNWILQKFINCIHSKYQKLFYFNDTNISRNTLKYRHVDSGLKIPKHSIDKQIFYL